MYSFFESSYLLFCPHEMFSIIWPLQYSLDNCLAFLQPIFRNLVNLLIIFILVIIFDNLSNLSFFSNNSLFLVRCEFRSIRILGISEFVLEISLIYKLLSILGTHFCNLVIYYFVHTNMFSIVWTL